MNKANFSHTGGFPMETDTLAFMQQAYTQLAAISGLGGKSYILSGCEMQEGNMTSGVVVIDGELLPFIGGPLQNYIVIEEVATNKTFQDGLSKPVFYNRVVKFASAGALGLGDLKRIHTLQDLSEAIPQRSSGAWVPHIRGTFSAMNNAGSFITIGNIVHLSGYARLASDAPAQISGNLFISELPDFIVTRGIMLPSWGSVNLSDTSGHDSNFEYGQAPGVTWREATAGGEPAGLHVYRAKFLPSKVYDMAFNITLVLK